MVAAAGPQPKSSAGMLNERIITDTVRCRPARRLLEYLKHQGTTFAAGILPIASQGQRPYRLEIGLRQKDATAVSGQFLRTSAGIEHA
jgi:hypothetical protein